MGVDAKMYAITEQELTENELRLASGQLVSIIGKNAFMIDKTGKWQDKPTHALSYGGFEDATLEHHGACGTLIKVNLMGRYYGFGYERGAWLDFRAIAEWLELNLGATVYYGADSDDSFELFDEKRRKEYNEHFLTVGHEPYRSYFGKEGNTAVVSCDFCGGRQMHDIGGGGNRTFWHCDGCDAKVITTPDSKIVLEDGEDFFKADRKLV